MQKPLLIPKGIKWSKLHVYCYACQRSVESICKQTGMPIQKCKNGDRHVFKIVLHQKGTRKGRITKNLVTRDVYEAVKQGLEFEKQKLQNKTTKFDQKFITEVEKDNEFNRIKINEMIKKAKKSYFILFLVCIYYFLCSLYILLFLKQDI